MNILYITPLVPDTPIKGHQVTGLNRLKGLHANSHVVTLYTLTDKKRDKSVKTFTKLNTYCKEVLVFSLPKWKSYLNVLWALFFTNRPLRTAYYRSSKLMATIKRTPIQEFDIVHINCLEMEIYGNYLLGKIPILFDMFDSQTLNLKRRVNVEKNFFKKIFYLIEYKRVKKFEDSIIHKYPSINFVAQKDRNYYDREGVFVTPIGTDEDYFKRLNPLPNNKKVVFFGNMSYSPNVRSIVWFIENCWDKIIEKVPNCSLYVVGVSPSREVKMYHNRKNIIVVGKVESIPDVLDSMQLSIAPMISGSGMQNKILEAMSCELPVVCTELARGTIDVINEDSILIGNTNIEIAQSCVRLLENYELCVSIGLKSREIILSKYSIIAHTKNLETMYSDVIKNYE